MNVLKNQRWHFSLIHHIEPEHSEDPPASPYTTSSDFITFVSVILIISFSCKKKKYTDIDIFSSG